MRIPSRRWIFCVWIEAFVGQHCFGVLSDCIGACRRSFFGDDVACERPMADRCDHVLPDAELGDGVFIGECGFVEVVERVGSVVDLFEPHLAQGECLVP